MARLQGPLRRSSQSRPLEPSLRGSFLTPSITRAPFNFMREFVAGRRGCMLLLDLWILNTTVLFHNYVSPLLQLREDFLLISVGDTALKLKHGTD